MADKFVNATGVQAIKTWIEGKFATITALTGLSDRVDEIVAEGGEPNVIDIVKVNGTALVPDAEKAVDVPTTTIDDDHIIESGGVNYVIRDHNNGEIVALSSAREGVYVNLGGGSNPDYLLPYKDDIPTNTNQLTNGAGFQNAQQVQALIDAELADITGIDFQVVDTLPATGEHGVIYLVHKGGTSDDIYDEFIWVTPPSGDPHYEQIGTTAVDLSDYWSTTDLQALTVTEINAILNA